ncbi:MAG: transporter ATP-binding protein [Candidatus Eremiobacteraeota bacterium]|nr:transporter ATP-binding protein [Candidatus Eremiobacteraeota bacterium]
MTTTELPLLETRDLCGRYGQIEAIHGIDITVERGAIVALLGANGSGKTSTLRAITGTIKCEGTVVYDGVALARRTPEDCARTGIAHVPEGRGTLSALSVWENLTLGAYTKNRKQTQERYERVVVYFPWLEDRKHQNAGTLSGGEQQMLAIARALMMEPTLMLLDEPSLGLAPMIVRQIFDLLRQINKDDGVSILVAEQNATVALAAADHAYVLEAGNVAVHGPGDELMRDDRVRRSYLGY